MDNNIPVFEPPKAPVFTPPPAPSFNGPACFHHQNEPAVARCVKCGKYVCKDCAESFTVIEGEYANKVLCFDCCEQLVSQNVAELTQNKNTIKGQFILQIIGMVIGFIVGISMGVESGDIGGGFVAALICAGIGGVFLTALKAWFRMQWEAIKLIFSGEGGWVAALIFTLLQSIIIVVQCVFRTLIQTVQYIIYLKKTSGFIESDTQALQQMRDYMEYTLVRSNNKGVDLETLMNEGSELYNNSYAQAVRTQGEEAADAALRQATTQINERGEIIRNFPSSNTNANAA